MHVQAKLVTSAAVCQTLGIMIYAAHLPARHEVLPHRLASPLSDTLAKRQNVPPMSKIQPNNGGGQADDCGRGPITLSAQSWNDRGMDALIDGIFKTGMPNPNFDFHQEFADRYGVDFYCPNSFSSCQSTPPSCSSLTRGTPAEKEQGWLGIKAMINVQEQFLQWEKVASAAADSLSSFSTNFEERFATKVRGSHIVPKSLFNALFGVITIVGAGIATVATSGAATGFYLGAIGTMGATATAIGSSITDANATPDLSVLRISDLLASLKRVVLEGLEGAHNASFSNGEAGSIRSATMQSLLAGGVFAGGEVVQAYVNSENGLNGFYSRFMAIKLLEAYWLGQGTFFIYIPEVTGDGCVKWHGNTGHGDILRFCAERGMLIMAGVRNDGVFDTPRGVTHEDVASVGGYNIPLLSLYESVYNMYIGHGLEAYKDLPFHSTTRSPGFFNIPVCELKAENWKQSDRMNKDTPPCDCLCATDAWGHKFIDSELLQESVKNWIRSKCTASCA